MALSSRADCVPWASGTSPLHQPHLGSYFDESGTHDGFPVLCVAGYLFECQSRQILDRKWKEILDQYRLPFFRMSARAHNTYPFDVLSRDECAEVEKAAIRLINEHALLGLAVAINEQDYNYFFARQDITGDAYSFCCWQILAGVQTWIARNSFAGEISYFFESGHKSETQANSIMCRIFNDKALRQKYRYKTHAFVDKEKVRPIQTADIYAWQQATQMKRWLKNNPKPRADFCALTAKPRHELFIGNRRSLALQLLF
jgi:uncharacterized protein DUF3800